MSERFSRISSINVTPVQNYNPPALNWDPVHTAEFISRRAIIRQLIDHDILSILVGNVKSFVGQEGAR